MTDKRYTLDEARDVLARQECHEQGHIWSVVERRAFDDPDVTLPRVVRVPEKVVCDRCRVAYRVAMEPS